MLPLASLPETEILDAGELKIAELEAVARKVRASVVKMAHTGKGAHLGSALSCIDILVAAYWTALRHNPRDPWAPERDRFILSKGHAASALYATLAHRGFFPVEDLATYAKAGSKLAEHPSPACAPGVEVGTGSLGHGLSLGLGMLLAGRINRQSYRAFAVLSDGECNEGSVWEAALLAPAKKIDNVCVVVDFNRWQATGRSEEVMAIQPFREKWKSFGWSAYEIDGNDMHALCEVLGNVPDGSGKPVAIVARTVKGKGISFMEDDNNWHYRIPDENDVARACAELGVEP